MRQPAFDRDQVIDKITNTFWEHGYEATSIAVLEAATGLKRQSLYNAFGNKESMFALALAQYCRVVDAPRAAALANPDPRAGLTRLFADQAAALLDTTNPSGCLVAGAQQELAHRDEGLGERIGVALRDTQTAYAAAFARWHAMERLVPDADPDDLGALVNALMRGQAAVARSPDGREAVTRVARVAPLLFEPFLA